MIADEFKRQTVRLPGEYVPCSCCLRRSMLICLCSAAGPTISDKDQSNFSDFTFVAPSALSN